jgi:hypothetical protein
MELGGYFLPLVPIDKRLGGPQSHAVEKIVINLQFITKCEKMVFKLLYIYDYITKLCGQQAEVIQNHENANVRNAVQGKARHRKYKMLKLDDSQAYDPSSD